jgi:hypothetical protein
MMCLAGSIGGYLDLRAQSYIARLSVGDKS